MELKNKVALILGAIKGIGKAISITLAKEGVKPVLNYYDWEEHLDDLKKDISYITNDFLITKTNLLETEKISLLIDKIIKHYGRLDILINNIERGGWPVVHGKYNREQWDLEIETTIRSKWWIFDKALPYLKANGDGVVVNISSISGIVGRSGPVSYIFNDAYSAANRSISLLTETWARMGAPFVRVNELMLGIFETRHASQTRGWNLLTEKQKKDIIDHTLLKRTGTIEDVSKAVLFLIKDSPFMTGSIIRIDGGYVLGGEANFPMPEGVI